MNPPSPEPNVCSHNLGAVTTLARRVPETAHDAQTTARAPLAVQQSFDALGTPLAEVTFVVLDLETTGTSPSECAITEVGAVRYRGGERVGVFQTLVNPGVPIPPTITVITGITEAMVLPAPPIDEVLPALLEFIGGAVIVGHNVRFDISFLDAADRKSTRLNSSHIPLSRMPSSA